MAIILGGDDSASLKLMSAGKCVLESVCWDCGIMGKVKERTYIYRYSIRLEKYTLSTMK